MTFDEWWEKQDYSYSTSPAGEFFANEAWDYQQKEIDRLLVIINQKILADEIYFMDDSSIVGKITNISIGNRTGIIPT